MCHSKRGHIGRAQHQLQPPPGMARGDMLALGHGAKAALGKTASQDPANQASKPAGVVGWSLAAVHHFGGAVAQLGEVGVRRVAGELGMVQHLGDAARGTGEATTKTQKSGARRERGRSTASPPPSARASGQWNMPSPQRCSPMRWPGGPPAVKEGKGGGGPGACPTAEALRLSGAR